MNQLPRTSFAFRFNAVLAAAAVTLTLMSGIDSLATNQGAASHLVQAAAATQPV
ncbi:MAG: hypothetical protein V4792_17395 [Pseudomonadota bacterium]